MIDDTFWILLSSDLSTITVICGVHFAAVHHYTVSSCNCSTASRISCACSSNLRSFCFMMTINSSPPQRTRISSSHNLDLTASDTATNASSPAECPYISLIRLNLSRSYIAIAISTNNSPCPIASYGSGAANTKCHKNKQFVYFLAQKKTYSKPL